MTFDVESLEINRPEALPFKQRDDERQNYWNYDHFERGKRGFIVSAHTVAVLRRWLRGMGFEATLSVINVYNAPLVGVRNRVCLRVCVAGATYEAEVAWLETLRRERLGRTRSIERLCQHFGLENAA